MDSAIPSFIELTSSNEQTARRFLEMTNGDVEQAVELYFEEDKPSTSKPSPPSNRFGTLQSLSQQQDASDDEDDDDKPTSYFAGGEKSGLSVQDPSKKSKGHNSLISSLLKKAQDAGGSHENPSSSKANPKSKYFTGPAQTLGSDDTPSQVIADPSSSSRPRQNPLDRLMPGGFGSQGSADDSEDEGQDMDTPVTRVLTFWQDGFSIDDGPLMLYSDPANAQALEDLNQGRAPLSLLNVKFGQRVDIQLADRKSEKYKEPPKKPAKPFEGQGNRLGSPAPAISGANSDQAKPPGTAEPFQPASTSFQVDNSQPTTSVQIRLGNGERMVGRFNHTHTVADIISYINASQPGASARSYVLQTAFPPQELKDTTKSIKEAGLINSVVVMKYT